MDETKKTAAVSDPELKALRTVLTALEKQPPSARKRILEYALARNELHVDAPAGPIAVTVQQ